MKEFFIIILVIVIGFIFWRWTSVGRGARKRDEILLKRLDSIGARLDKGEEVSVREIETIGSSPEIRYMLFNMLRHMQREDLMPNKYLSSIDQGASALAYWMMHPNELEDPPEQIEYIETIERNLNGIPMSFHVYRYKMKAGHWSTANQEWQIGLAGPIEDNNNPYAELIGAFSRAGDIEGKCSPTELVDWYVDMLKRKGLVT